MKQRKLKTCLPNFFWGHWGKRILLLQTWNAIFVIFLVSLQLWKSVTSILRKNILELDDIDLSLPLTSVGQHFKLDQHKNGLISLKSLLLDIWKSGIIVAICSWFLCIWLQMSSNESIKKSVRNYFSAMGKKCFLEKCQ